MKKIILLAVLLLAIAIGLFLVFNSPFDEEYDLGRLKTATAPYAATYCQYTITDFECELDHSFFNIGDTTCIECCTSRTPPWPPRVSVNNNCPKKIKFTSADGTCVYYGTRINQTCSSCPKAKGVYQCPNP